MIDLNKVEFFLRDQNDQTERMKKNEIFLQIKSPDSFFMIVTNAFHDRFQIEFVDYFLMMLLECVECECAFLVRTSNPSI